MKVLFFLYGKQCLFCYTGKDEYVKENNTETCLCSGMPCACNGISFFDRADSAVWKCIVSHAYPGTFVRLFVRMAVWSACRFYCANPQIFCVRNAAPYAHGNCNGV